jgi:hypothetical protein
VRKVIAHGHIFKNAGTTFDWSLARNFGDEFLDHRDDTAMRELGADHVSELLRADEKLQAISSHCLCCPLPQMEGAQTLPVFFLRHPVARIQSVYTFERQQEATTPGAKAAKNLTFRNYVTWRMQPEVARTIRNFQTFYLAGANQHIGDSAVDGAVFELALNTLQRANVGIVERYDESMVVLEARLGEHFDSLDLAYVRQNVSRLKPWQRKRDPVTQVLKKLGALQREVLDNNSLDMALYHLACLQLEEEISRIPDFAMRLTRFRQRCEELDA